ncbi:MAG: YdcF family protein [Caldilineaceae bacterium]
MKKYILLGTAALLLILYFLRIPLLTRIGSYPVVASELQPSDLIAVMSGALPEIHYGIDLYKQGLAPKMLFVGEFPVDLAVVNKEPFEVVQMSWDEIALHYAASLGVQKDEILTSDAFASSTYERVADLLQVVEQHHLHSVIVVSDLLHTRRIADSARCINPSIRVLTAPTPQEYYPAVYRFHPESWWHYEADIKDVFGEYVKLLFYALGYK